MQARTGVETKPASQKRSSSRRMSEEPDCHGATRINRPEHQIHAPSSPMDALQCETEPRFYSTQAFASGPSEHAKEALGSGKGGSFTQKKDRRATMRLEADRIELEKRLRKLEQAANAQDSTALRRESRRLTKKQPLGSSSRASSASADETKSSSRFSSVFSRRTSRSRSSSMNEGDKRSSRRQASGTETTVENVPTSESRECTASPVPITLPVRLGAAISKGLAVTNNASISAPRQLGQSPTHLHSDADSLDISAGVNEAASLGGGVAYHAEQRSNPLDESNSGKVSLMDSKVASDLDRALFAATLKLGRDSDNMQIEGSHKQNIKARRKPSTPSRTNHGAGVSDSQLFTPSLHPSMMRNTSIRSLAEKMPQRHSKKFTSSPLAGTPKTSDLDGHSDAASADSTKFHVPTIASDRRASDIIFSRTVLSSRTMEKPIGPANGARSSLNALNELKSNSSVPSPHLLESPKGGGRLCSNSGKTSTLPHAKGCSASTLDHPKAKSPSRTPLRRESQRQYFPEHTGNDRSATIEPVSKPGMPQAVQGHTNAECHLELEGVNAEQDTLSHEPRMSNISLATSVSQDQGSEEYNTADEAVSIPSPSRDEKGSTGQRLDHPAAGISHGSVQDPFEKGPKTVLSSAVLPPTRELNNAKRPCHEQSVAKLFVICCHCQSWHDMPSGVYRALAFSAVSHGSKDRRFAPMESRSTRSNGRLLSKSANAQTRSSRNGVNAEVSSRKNPESASAVSSPSLVVKCCWCEHDIRRTCCQAWTTTVQLCEKQS